MAELQEELNNVSRDKQKVAVKKVVAGMMVGKDVSSLFMSMLKCMQTTDLELKKLVYLYLINYAKEEPELAIMAVNSFVNDSRDPNPLVRSLALRTMGCINVEKIAEYLCDPLRTALTDTDPYVRKTAAMCVVKLFDMNPEMVEDQGYVENLTDLLADANPMVVTNAVAALTEMSAKKPYFVLRPDVVTKLLTVLNEATPWGQVYVLDALSSYRPRDGREAAQIMDRVSARLNHETSAVSISAIRLIMLYMPMIAREDAIPYAKKMAPPLVSMALLNAQPEVQYVALRNIGLILQKVPKLLDTDYKVFFCKYNDPLYVKMEKLDRMVQIANAKNVESCLAELKEYAQEIDVEFVMKSVRSIGRIAVNLEPAAERCVEILLELLATKVNYVVQEGIVVIKDIFRKYPNRYEAIIGNLCDALDTLDEPEAKAALIWIIGEYSDRIENSGELLESFAEAFHEEPSNVQLQLLTAVVKLFLHRAGEAQELMSSVLSMCTQESDNPDLRDRGFIYWRLLSTDPESAKMVVVSEKPVISADTGQYEPELLDELISQLGTLSSVYHKPASHFVTEFKAVSYQGGLGGGDAGGEGEGGGYIASEDYTGEEAPEVAPPPIQAGGGGDGGLSRTMSGDLLGLGDAPALATVLEDKPMVLPPEKTGGLQIHAALARSGGDVMLDVTLVNNATDGTVFSGFHIQFNKNACGLKPEATAVPVDAVLPGERRSAELRLITVADFVPPPDKPIDSNLQCAAKFSGGTGAVCYFRVPFSLATLTMEDGRMDKALYLQTWRSIPNETEVSKKIEGLCQRCQSTDNVIDLLEDNNIFNTARRQEERGQVSLELLYASMRTVNDVTILCEFTFPRGGGNVCKVSVRTGEPTVIPLVLTFVENLLKTGQV
jgi:AP-1 complex subunit beta-1